MNMHKTSSNAVAVQGTNDSSIVSKCSMVQSGYYSDPFIKHFVLKPSRRAPLINRGYYIRAKAIDTVITNFLKSCSEHEKQAQILSLGAGFDTLYFRVKNEQMNLKVLIIETDFPDILERKKMLIQASSLSSDLQDRIKAYTSRLANNGTIVLDLDDYKLLGVDLNNVDALEHLLRECHIDTRISTLLLSECAITYMEESKSSCLIKWAASFFKNALFATYEQILPDDSFGLVMFKHFQNIGSPLRSINKYPNIIAQQQRYLALDWQRCEVIDMNSFYTEYLLPEEKCRIDRLELFEEFEEFHLKCSHYVLICAENGNLLNYLGISNSNIRQHLRFEIPVIAPLHPIDGFANVARFGHQSQMLGSTLVVTVGGFGNSKEGGHRRLSNVLLSDLDRRQDFLVEVDADLLKNGRLHHSLTAISDNALLVIGGRTSPAKCCSDIVTITSEYDSDLINNSPSIKISNMVLPNSRGEESRWRHTATAVLINGKIKVVVFGGRNQSSQALGDCYFLDVDTCQWTEIEIIENGPNARHSHAGCAWNQSVVISGGLDAACTPLNSIHILDCVTCKWMRLTIPIAARYSHSAHSWKSKLFLIGGVNSQSGPPPGIDIIDPLTNYYCQLSLLKMPRPHMFHKHSSVLVNQQEAIFILGGGGTCFSFGTHLNCGAMMLNLNELCLLFENHKMKY